MGRISWRKLVIVSVPVVAAVAGLASLIVATAALGYGDPLHTVKAPGYPACSVTAYGPTFSSNLKSQTYGGGTSCRGGIGTRSIVVVAQVRGAGGKWFAITGSTRVGGPTSTNPLRVSATRASFLGHVYRTLATAHLIVPNGFAGCSLHKPPACNESITVTAASAPIAP